MKRVLALLLAFVFLQTQTWALSGGPNYGGDIATFTGTYAGVLIPQVDPLAVIPAAGQSTSIGLFSMIQPDVGLATGSLVVFVNGAAFNGNINGIIDPEDGAFSGVVDAVSTFTVTQIVPSGVDANGNITFTTEDFVVQAQGNMQAEVRTDPGTTNTTSLNLTNPARIEGTATIDVFFLVDDTTGTPIISETTTFQVDGFKQSDSFATATDINIGTGNQP